MVKTITFKGHLQTFKLNPELHCPTNNIFKKYKNMQQMQQSLWSLLFNPINRKYITQSIKAKTDRKMENWNFYRLQA